MGLKPYKEYGKFREIINQVNEAALERRRVEIFYYAMSQRKRTKRKVDPYRIWFFNGTFYLIGFCHLRNEIRTFALDRIRMLSPTEETFTVPEDFKLEDFLRSSFGVFQGKPRKVKIRPLPIQAARTTQLHRWWRFLPAAFSAAFVTCMGSIWG